MLTRNCIVQSSKEMASHSIAAALQVAAQAGLALEAFCSPLVSARALFPVLEVLVSNPEPLLPSS
jgi:hypothetical protein